MEAPDDRTRALRTAVDAREAVGEMLDTVVAIDELVASLTASRFELVAQAQRLALLAEGTLGTTGHEMARRAFRAELACALVIPEVTADRLTSEAESLVSDLPDTLVALRAGRIRERHARILVDQLSLLSPEDRADVEAAALPLAPTLTATKFERRVRALRERRAPDDQIARHERARDTRDVVLHPEHDGMAWLGALLPAVEAVAIHARLDATARSLRQSGDSRTLAQLRANLFCSVLLEGEGSGEGEGEGNGATGLGATGLAVVERSCFQAIRPRVIVTVPALTLLDRDSEPATLEGYGPIDAATARRLASNAPALQRLLTHPHTGAELSLDRTRYRVTDELRTWLRVRDGGCRFPGCGRSARGCDVDHTHDWSLDGPTAHDNLAHLCRAHHILKHDSSWSVRQRADRAGDLEWRSPLGRTYSTEPAFERTPAGPEWRASPD